jgi:SAM-dependent methyltransferase
VSKRPDENETPTDMEAGMTTAERRRRRRRGAGLRVPSDNVPRRTPTQPPVVPPVPEDPNLAVSIAYSFGSDASGAVRGTTDEMPSVDGRPDTLTGDGPDVGDIIAPEAQSTVVDDDGPFEVKTREMTAVDLEVLGLEDPSGGDGKAPRRSGPISPISSDPHGSMQSIIVDDDMATTIGKPPTRPGDGAAAAIIAPSAAVTQPGTTLPPPLAPAPQSSSPGIPASPPPTPRAKPPTPAPPLAVQAQTGVPFGTVPAPKDPAPAATFGEEERSVEIEIDDPRPGDSIRKRGPDNRVGRAQTVALSDDDLEELMDGAASGRMASQIRTGETLALTDTDLEDVRERATTPRLESNKLAKATKDESGEIVVDMVEDVDSGEVAKPVPIGEPWRADGGGGPTGSAGGAGVSPRGIEHAAHGAAVAVAPAPTPTPVPAAAVAPAPTPTPTPTAPPPPRTPSGRIETVTPPGGASSPGHRPPPTPTPATGHGPSNPQLAVAPAPAPVVPQGAPVTTQNAPHTTTPPPMPSAAKDGHTPPPMPKAPPPPAPGKKPVTVTAAAAAAAAAKSPADKRAKRGKPWFEEIFDEDYLRTLPFLTPQATQAEAQFVVDVLAVQPGAQLLDLGCGYGRHAMELAARGFHMVGLDLSLPLLLRGADEAQRRGLSINFVHADMRELDFDAQFDGVYCLFSTFGFFDDETNKKTATAVARALKPGGRFVIEVLNRDYVIGELPTRVWWEGDGCVVLEEVEFNYFSSRIHSNRSVVFDDGRQIEQEISIRAYSLHELGKLLHAAGFRVVEVSGSVHTRGRYFGNQSRHIVVVAEKKARDGGDK